MNFIYLARFSTLSVMKLVVEDDVVVNETSYCYKHKLLELDK